MLDSRPVVKLRVAGLLENRLRPDRPRATCHLTSDLVSFGVRQGGVIVFVRIPLELINTDTAEAIQSTGIVIGPRSTIFFHSGLCPQGVWPFFLLVEPHQKSREL